MTGHVRFDKGSEGDGGNGGGGGGGGSGPSRAGSTNRLNQRRRRAPYQSQPNLNRMQRMSASRATSMYRLNHLNPEQKKSIGKSYVSLAQKKHIEQTMKRQKKLKQVNIDMEGGGGVRDGQDGAPAPPKRGMYSNKHIASAHKLISDSDDDEPSFKKRLRAVMNTYNFQILMVVLIILDCVMVLGEMIIEMKLFQNEECHQFRSHGSHGGTAASHGAHSDTSSTTMMPTTVESVITTTMGSLLENVTEAAEGHFSGLNKTFTGIQGAFSEMFTGAKGGNALAGHSLEQKRMHCEHFEHLLHSVEHVFHLTSIFILFLFNVELLLRLYAESYKYFLHLEIALDAMIVMVSFGLDIVFLDHAMKKYLYLLIILRVWRVLRVVHAIITAIRAPHERQIEKLKKKKKMLQRDLAKAYFYSNMLEEEIISLRAYIDSFEVIEEYDDEDDYGYDDGKIPVCQRTVQSEHANSNTNQQE